VSRAAAALALGALCAAAPASAADRAAEGAARRFQIGLRSGYGLPFGRYADVRQLDAFRDSNVNALSDDTHGAIPLWLDLGYRLTPKLELGVYAMYGIVLPREGSVGDPLGGGCPEGLECSGGGVRFGVQGHYHFSPEGRVDPWLGLGVGYEWITSHVEGRVIGVPIDLQTSHGGPELLHLQAGVDLRATPVFGFGPFAALSLMQYTSCSAELDGNETECRLPDAAWHGWLLLGVRATLGL
jgi:hypothetical protein